MTIKYEKYDSVRVKDGIKDVDSGNDMSGWCGRVHEVDKDVIGLKWDSITLKSIPSKLITEWEKGGLDWQSYYISLDEIEPADARDTLAQSRKAYAQLAAAHAWDDFDGPDGKLIREVLQDVDDPADEYEALGAWEDYLTENLELPFAAKVEESDGRGPIKLGDKVKVVGLEEADEHYGIIVELRVGRRKNHFPLCDLKAIDKSTHNYLCTKAYAVWFANR